MASENVLPPSLPLTVAARRNARLRAAARAAIPVFLFLLAAALRLWEPDLVPFGLRQAEYVSAANSHAPLSWTALYADRTVTPLMLVQPLLRELPAPVVVWVALRGLLDSLGVALLFLVARPLVGVWGATLAALLYAVNPSLWAAARDPAGPLSAVVMAAALWAAVRLVRRPTLLRGAILGLMLGLLARGVSPALVVVALGAVTLAFGRASWKVGGVTALALVACALPALIASPDGTVNQTFDSVALAWPGWLVSGLAYQPPDGQAVGTTFLALDSLTLAVLIVLLLAVHVVGACWLIWRGYRTLLFPLTWLGASWLAARPILLPPTGPSAVAAQPPNFVPDPATVVMLLPPLALMIVLPFVAAHVAARWWGLGMSLFLLAVSGATIGLSMEGMTAVAAGGRAFTVAGEIAGGGATSVSKPDVHRRAPGLDVSWRHQRTGAVKGLGHYATLRDWTALASAVGEAAARVETDEALVADAPGSSIELKPLETLLEGRVRVRSVPSPVLPLERETIYVVAWTPASASELLGDLRSPTSAVGVYTPAGVDTGVRLLTVRPRPESDWLARTQLVQNGQFADGSALVAFELVHAQQRISRIRLYWRLPVQSGANLTAVQIRPFLLDSCLEVTGIDRQMPAGARRGGELVVAGFGVREGPGARACVFDPRSSMTIELVDSTRQNVRTSSGADRLTIPFRRELPPTPEPAPQPLPQPSPQPTPAPTP